MRDHPGDFNNKVGDDLYLNPWWGLRRLNGSPHVLAMIMNQILGEPVLHFYGHHELVWGTRGSVPDNHRSAFPCFYVNFSGPQDRTYYHFWLPWRENKYDQFGFAIGGKNVLHTDILPKIDLPGLRDFAINHGFEIKRPLWLIWQDAIGYAGIRKED